MNTNKNKHYDEDSLDLIELFSKLWNRKNSIIKSTLIFSLFGFILSLSLSNIYTASSTFYPHYEKSDFSQSSSLKNLAGLAGIDLGSESLENVPPTL